MATDLSFSININGIEKTITSTAELSKVVKDLTKTFVENTKAGKDVTSTLMSLQQAAKVRENLVMVSKGAVQMQQGMQGAQTASANASMALLNLNYVIRDSPYFFNNFALGVLAVGNNLNPLIDSFNRLRTEAVGKSISTFQLLKQALVGGAGISIAFSLVVTAIQSFVFWQSRSKTEVEKTTKSLKDQRSELEKLTRGQLQNAIALAEVQLSDVMPKGAKRLVGFGGKTVIVDKNGNPITEGKAFELNQNLNVLRQQYYMLGDIENIENRLTINRQKLKDLNAQNFNVLVREATTLNEAREILQGWIKDDEKQLDIWKGKTKELKEQKRILNEASSDLFGQSKSSRAGDLKAFSGGTGIENKKLRPSIFSPRSTPSDRGDTNRAFGFGGAVKELDTTLELAKIGAQELGSALEGAFTGAKIKLSDLINQITVAITKMLILQGITSLLTGGLGASASVPSASVGGKEGMRITSGWGDATRFKKQSVNVTVSGRFRANGKEFIADFKNAEKQIDLMRL